MVVIKQREVISDIYSFVTETHDGKFPWKKKKILSFIFFPWPNSQDKYAICFQVNILRLLRMGRRLIDTDILDSEEEFDGGLIGD